MMPAASPSWPPSANSTRSGWSRSKRPAGTKGSPLPCCGAPASRRRSSTHGLCAALPRRWGFLEKTDRIDSGIIAWFAEVKRVAPQRPAGAAQRRLAALVTRLRQLTELRTAQTNQRRLVTDPTALASFAELLGLIARQIKAIAEEIGKLIASDPLWRTLDLAWREIKGVADRTVARLMAELPEIGTLSSKAVSKLAGLAPLARDSGKLSGNRPVRGGRSGVRSILFVVAELVRRHDTDFAAFHRRLTLAGKPKKVIRVALAHKLLVRLNAKARDVRAQIACPA
jgi:transposase